MERTAISDRYAEVAALLGPLLDCLALIPDAPVAPLREPLGFNDPHLQLVVAIGLLARGEDVPPHVWDSIAASDGERADLLRVLNARGRHELFSGEVRHVRSVCRQRDGSMV